MKNGIPNQKYRANKMMNHIMHDFCGSRPRSILVVTYILDKDLTFTHIRKTLEDAGIAYSCNGDYDLTAKEPAPSNWLTLVSVIDSMEYRGDFTDAYLFCEKSHLEKAVKRKVAYCMDIHCIFDKEI